MGHLTIRRVIPLGAICLGSVITSQGGAPPWDSPKPMGPYLRTIWTTEHGLPQNSVTAITQTRDGYLWVGTFGGVARFDGVRFTVFTTANTKGLKSDRITTLYEDRAGRLWIGTEHGGVTRYSRGTWTSYTTKEGLPYDSVPCIFEDRDATLWVATTKGLARYRDEVFTPVTDWGGLALTNLMRGYWDREGTLWLGFWGGGLVSVRGGISTVYQPLANRRSDNWVRVITQGRDGSVYIGTRKGLLQFRQGKMIRHTTREGLSRNEIECVLEDRAANLWVGTQGGGLNRFAEGRWTGWAKRDGLSDDSIRTLFEDREGNLWVGTNTGGLIRLKRSPVKALGQAEGFAEGGVIAMMADRAGNVWIGTACQGVFRFRQERRAMRVRPSEGCVWSLLVDPDGTIWYGTWGGGLTRWQEGTSVTYTTANSDLSHDVVVALFRDHQGTLWIGTQEGLNRFQNDRFTIYRTTEGLVDNFVRFITEDRQGALWIGTVGGLSRFQHGQFTNFTTADGLSHNFVRDIYQDDDGTLWIATYGGGLNRYRDGRFLHYTTQNGLFDDFISRILADDRGNLWMSSNQGIFRVSRQELDDYAAGRIAAITSVGYGVADGMITSECNGGGQPAGWRAPDGRLWFPTLKGPVVIDPSLVTEIPPLVAIEQLRIDHTGMDLWQSIIAPPGQGDLEIHYTGLSFAAPEKVRFRYRLEGYDAQWIEAGARRVAYYTNIPPGRYRFRVLATNSDGVWGDTGASLEFRLRPHFYQTAAFYLLIGGVLGALGWSGYKLRVNHLERRARLLEAKITERTTEILRQKDQLARQKEQLVQMNEHLGLANENLLSLLDQLAIGVVLIDRSGVITFLNRAAERMVGQLRQRLLGRPWRELFSLPEETKALVEDLYRDPPADHTKVPLQLRTAAGRRYWIEIEVMADPRDPHQRILFFYDMSEVYDLRRLLDEKAKFHELIGDSPAMMLLYQQIQDLAQVDTTVLITGETGTGKELAARAIHYASPRRGKPFIAVNCAGLNESLLGSQLFGHKRGSFTGAIADHLGFFEAASGGTLFLDEIGDLPLNMQTSLLRVLQEKEITRLGESHPRKVDVRVIVATNRDLDHAVSQGQFRQDLYYRIRVARIHLPPLRERRQDIPLLVAWFLGQMRERRNPPLQDVSQEAMQLLMNYRWPGNVRELKSAIEWAVVRCKGPLIQPADLPPELSVPGGTPHEPPPGGLGQDEKTRILEALTRTEGNRRRAARLLGISRATLYRRMKDLGIM